MPAETAADPYPGQAVMLYDGDCPLCRTGVRVLKALDWLRVLAYHNGRDVEHLPPTDVPLDPVRLMEEMHLLTPDRKHAYAGYEAFRWMAWRLPLTMPFAPLLYVPGVPWVGHRVYLWVARNRLNLVPCRDGACRVPLKGAKSPKPAA